MRLNNISESDFSLKLNKIKIFMFDLDGVLLNNSDEIENLYLQMKNFCAILKKENHFTGIITARELDGFTSRLNKIDNCFVITASMNKYEMMKKKLEEYKIDFENLFYVGDDILDLPLLQKAGISCAPENARREVKRVVHVVFNEIESNNLLVTILSLGKKTESVN